LVRSEGRTVQRTARPLPQHSEHDLRLARRSSKANHYRLTGSFGKTEITVPRARLQTSDGRTTECKALRVYQRRTLTADALIAGRLSRGHQYATAAARAGSAVPRRRVAGDCATSNSNTKRDGTARDRAGQLV